ncbi:ENTH domain-containing protein [Gorgonomyces haynaldii]|nr:ENTH domain-containing protein [Gorgonomyces haynaldii]
MAEISNLSHRSHDFVEIMDIIDKRLNDSGKNWRHVYKTLILLHYLLESGSEQVVSHAKRNLHVIKTLKEFQYIDEEGRDQGMNVRQKCKEVTSLLTDDSKLKEIRANRGVVHDRISGDYQGDDDELRRAIELSKKQMEIDAHKRYGGFPGDENLTLQEQQDLQRAIELSEQEAIQRSINERNNAVSKGDDIIDFFGSLETPQQQQSDPFAGFGGVDPFAQQQMYQQQMYQQQWNSKCDNNNWNNK